MSIKLKNFRPKKAFTLVEVLVASVIFVVLITIGMASFSNIINWKKRDNSNNELQAVGRHAMEVMTQGIENADLNQKISFYTVGEFFGFRMLTPGDNFMNGVVNSASQLKVYSSDTGEDDERATVYQLDGARLKKGADFLTPSSIKVTELKFSGFQKTSDSLASSSYQQPYVTISITLETVQKDPQTNQSKTATFKTTVRPQNFDSMGYVEVQSGEQLANKVNNNEVKFAGNFSKAPTVVTARVGMNEDDDDSSIQSITTSNFTFSVSTSDQSSGQNPGRNNYWIAVNGNFPGLIKSGKVNAKLATNRCEVSNATCVSYGVPFVKDPVVTVVRGWKAGDYGRTLMQNYVRKHENMKETLAISGDQWNGGSNPNPSWFYWIAVDPDIKLIMAKQANGATKKVVDSGYQSNKLPATAPMFSCPAVQYQPVGSQPGTLVTKGYKCAYYTARPTAQDPYSYKYDPAYGPAKISFTSPFASKPKVVISVVSNFTEQIYRDFANPYAQRKSYLNTPGVYSIGQSNFQITNIGGDVDEPGDNALLYNTSEKDKIRSNGINWMAVSDNFKLTWEYK